MNNKSLLKTGITGTFISAICCFTPLLVWLFATVGLSAMIGYLDFVLLPVLAISILVTIYALYQRSRA